MTTAKKASICREDALSLLGYIGFKSCSKWDNARLASKLLGIKDLLPDEKPDDEDLASVLIDVLANIEDGSEFEVFDNSPVLIDVLAFTDTEPEGAEDPSVAARAARVAEMDAAEAAAVKADARADREAEKASRVADRKAIRLVAAQKKAVENLAAKNSKRTRLSTAADVLVKYGLHSSHTNEEIVAEIDALCGNPNSDATLWTVRQLRSCVGAYHKAEDKAAAAFDAKLGS